MPLTELTKEKVGWQWDKQEDQSFLALKAAMATAPVLRLPDFEHQFVVTTDAERRGNWRYSETGLWVRPPAYSIFEPEAQSHGNTLFSV